MDKLWCPLALLILNHFKDGAWYCTEPTKWSFLKAPTLWLTTQWAGLQGDSAHLVLFHSYINWWQSACLFLPQASAVMVSSPAFSCSLTLLQGLVHHPADLHSPIEPHDLNLVRSSNPHWIIQFPLQYHSSPWFLPSYPFVCVIYNLYFWCLLDIQDCQPACHLPHCVPVCLPTHPQAPAMTSDPCLFYTSNPSQSSLPLPLWRLSSLWHLITSLCSASGHLRPPPFSRARLDLNWDPLLLLLCQYICEALSCLWVFNVTIVRNIHTVCILYWICLYLALFM